MRTEWDGLESLKLLVLKGAQAGAANITLTSHTPVFCLAPVRSRSPRSAMGLSPVEARGPEQRLREPVSCRASVRSTGKGAAGGRP